MLGLVQRLVGPADDALVSRVAAMDGQDRLLSQSAGFYDQFVSGHWATLDQLGKLPASKGNGSLPPDTQYGPGDTHRLWQTWVSYNAPPVLELEVSYPSEAFERKQDQRGYQFRIDVSGSTGEAERKNTAFGFEPSEEMLLSQNSTQKLRLPIP